jgi:hypothetical protein
MHISFILAIVGIVGYMVNMKVVEHYMRVKAYQLSEQSRTQRRRSSESRNVKSKAEERLMKEVPKLKWTVWFGAAMALTFIVGFVWSFIRMIQAFIK